MVVCVWSCLVLSCLVARAISASRGLRGQRTDTSKLMGGVYIKAERKTLQFLQTFCGGLHDSFAYQTDKP